VDSGKYDTRDDFTVVLQPFFENTEPVRDHVRFITNITNYEETRAMQMPECKFDWVLKSNLSVMEETQSGNLSVLITCYDTI
jgi:hypothetical protein